MEVDMFGKRYMKLTDYQLGAKDRMRGHGKRFYTEEYVAGYNCFSVNGDSMKQKILRMLQNSIFTRWLWTVWRHRKTGRYILIPIWNSPGMPWYKTNHKE
jgi:hypothetical protein